VSSAKQRSSRRLLAAFVVVAVAAAVVWYFGWGNSRALTAGSGLAWASAAVQVGDIEVTVTGTAALQPTGVERVRTAVSGTIRRVLAQEGDRVTAGQPLLELDNESVLLALEQAFLNYEAEVEKLEQLRASAGGTGGNTALRSAELAVASARMTLETRQQQVQDLQVRAPVGGIVGEVAVHAGDQVGTGGLLATLLDDTGGHVKITVGEDRVRDVRPGDPASIILGPLPQISTVRLVLDEISVYGLRVGDRVEANIAGEWVSSQSFRLYGSIVSITPKSGRLFDVVCRLPGVPASVPAGASIPYMQIYPSGEQGKGTVITAAGNLTIETDAWGLEELHAAGEGLAAEVLAVPLQGTRTQSGAVAYEVTLVLTEPSAEARSGMSVHAAVEPGAGGPIYSLSTYDLPLGRLTSSSGGKVQEVLVRAGDEVAAGQLLMVLTNDNLLHQLEQARNDLVVQENRLRDLGAGSSAERDLRAQEIRVRQAELALEARQAEAEGLVVMAPQAGRISGWSSDLAAGRNVNSGFEVCRVLNYDTMEMRIMVDELQVAGLRRGMAAAVTVDALPGQVFEAVVRDVSEEGQYSQGVSRFEVVLQLAGATGLRAQMTANATISVAQKRGVLIAPAEAVTLFGGTRGAVNVLAANGAIEAREIQVGLRSVSQVEVTGGLTAGERVITGMAGSNQNTGRFGTVPGGGTITVPGGGGTITVPGGGSTPGGVRPR